MSFSTEFYDDLSDSYHLMYDDWSNSIAEDAGVIASLLGPASSAGKILDCSCGIGTQLIPLKELGYAIDGSDISEKEIGRAMAEVKARGLEVDLRVDDMRTLETAQAGSYGAVISIGNSLPHLLSDGEIVQAFRAMAGCLAPGGYMLISVRDYEPILESRMTTLSPFFIEDEHGRRIVHQIWDWVDERMYRVHVYITREVGGDWDVRHFVGEYRAITLGEIKALMSKADLEQVSVLMPEETGFCQPILKAYRR